MWTLCLLFPANLWVLDCWAGRMSHMNKSVSALGCKLNMLSILFNSVFGKRLPTVLREFVFHPPKNGEEKCSAYTWHQLWHVYTKYTWLCQTSNDLGLADLRTALLLIHDELVHGDLTEIRMNGFWIDGIISVDMHSPIQSEIWLCNLCHNTLLTTMQLSHMFRLFHRRVYLWM